MTQSSTYLQAYNDYHDTGVSWLGEIPAHWDIRQLRYIADIRLSGVDKKSRDDEPTVMLCNYTDVYYNEVITDELEFMTATASPDAIERFALKAGDVVITKDSESWDDIAVPAYVPNDLPNVICGYHLALIRPSSEIFGKFLFWAFAAQSITYQFHVNAGGITRFGLSQQAIKDGIFPIPPLTEQTAIVNYLDHETSKIDTLIVELNNLLKLVSEKRQATISHAVTRGINPDVALVDSGIEWIGEIPHHWEIEKGKYLFRQSSLPVQDDDEIVTCFRDGQVTLRRNRRETGFTNAVLELGYQGVRQDQLVVHSMDAFAGAIGISDSSGKCSPEYIICDPIRDTVYIPYYGYLLREMALRRFIQAICPAVRERAPRIRFSDIKELDLPIPPIEEQMAIVHHIEAKTSVFQDIVATSSETIQLFQERRSALIAAAVTGKIRVTE